MLILILAGGSGTRLWPLSRKNKPKQFQKLVSDKTLFEETIERVQFAGAKNIFISTNEEYFDEVCKQSKKFGIPKEQIIIEPCLRDTAPCIGLAATIMAKKRSAQEVMAIIYADHLVQEVKIFEKLLKEAEKIAQEKNTLNIIEVKARFPNTSLGYVKIGKLLEERNGVEVYEFEKFIEKPDLKTAKKLLNSYKYLWNTGFYIWKIETILKKFKEHMPKTAKELEKIAKSSNTEKAIQDFYKNCEKISIDYGIMEKVSPKEVRIIPAELGWSDIGTWESLFDELTNNEKENLTKADIITIDTEGSIIYGPKSKLIATIGIRDLVIVDTGDALLICKKGRSQEVKKIVEQLQKKRKEVL
ncbi:MAG: sugar phosphate nucleotidyltransferase [Patescibacteria group bacterium]